jgi:hypothetical protein
MPIDNSPTLSIDLDGLPGRITQIHVYASGRPCDSYGHLRSPTRKECSPFQGFEDGLESLRRWRCVVFEKELILDPQLEISTTQRVCFGVPVYRDDDVRRLVRVVK